MKKTFLLIFATMCATLSFAQLQLATLNHNDTISVFYGGSALRNAYEASVTGDIITLSPGSFLSVNITQPITLRGAGMFADTISGTEPTIIMNDFNINVDDTIHHLYMEGIYFMNEMECKKIFHPQFVKCYFDYVKLPEDSGVKFETAVFINCIILDFYDRYSSRAKNTQFINSVILKMNGGVNSTLINSIAQIVDQGNLYREGTNTSSYINKVSIMNSIVFAPCVSSVSNSNIKSSFNSIGLNTSNSGSYSFYTSDLYLHNLRNYQGFESIFKTFRGICGPNIDFQLTDSVAAVCLGTDGTQVGVYGGPMPFDPSVRNPLIKKVNVAPRSNAEGKLEVEVEVVSE